jgi:hypothetical protein
LARDDTVPIVQGCLGNIRAVDESSIRAAQVTKPTVVTFTPNRKVARRHQRILCYAEARHGHSPDFPRLSQPHDDPCTTGRELEGSVNRRRQFLGFSGHDDLFRPTSRF